MGLYFWVAKISNIFRVLDIPDIIWGGGGGGGGEEMNGRCWVQAYV